MTRYETGHDILKVYTLSYPMVPSQLIAYEKIQKYYKLKMFIIRSDFVPSRII